MLRKCRNSYLNCKSQCYGNYKIVFVSYLELSPQDGLVGVPVLFVGVVALFVGVVAEDGEGLVEEIKRLLVVDENHLVQWMRPQAAGQEVLKCYVF